MVSLIHEVHVGIHIEGVSHYCPPIVRKDVATGRRLVDAIAVDVKRRPVGSRLFSGNEPASHLNGNRDVHQGTHDAQA